MKTLYIGAKCVPSFYIGSGGSSEWASGVSFEPLTVVTYNGTWFISKKPVPAGAAAPEAGEYWAQVPGYVTDVTPEELQAILDDIEDLQETVGDLDDLDTIAKTDLVSAVNEVKGETTDLRDDLYQIVETTYVRGVLNADGTINTSAQGVISDVESGVNTFIVKTDCKAAFALYSGNTYLGKMNANYVLDKVPGSWGYYIPGTYDVSEYLTLYGADSIRIFVVPTNGVNIPAGQENAYGQAHAEYRYYKYAPLTYVNSTFAKKHGNGNNYALTTNFCKIPVAIEYLGSLNYLQAFCKYNNCYYSIEGTHITKQDSNFNIQQIAVLDTGHGNSFQLGYSHYAYAFGWDDNTVYVVDLDTLTVSDTIQLPTTGYTSGVVDEINGLIYIFQRNDYPITEASFNFIVYDYVNDQIISTRKTIPFGAVQACDFLDDRIFAVNGLGNSTCPNGYRIYDLNGNILSSYVLGDFETTEPEGIFIDRDTKEVMISFIDTKVYKLN